MIVRINLAKMSFVNMLEAIIFYCQPIILSKGRLMYTCTGICTSNGACLQMERYHVKTGITVG